MKKQLGKKKKMGKWASVFKNGVNWSLQAAGSGLGYLYLGISGMMGGSKVMGNVGTAANYCLKPLFTGAHKRKAKKISKLVGYYKYGNNSSKNVLIDVLTNVAVEIFAHLEWQFMHVLVNCDWKDAIHKLATDAIARTMDYMNSVDIPSVENLTELTNLLIKGVLHGNSKESYISTFIPTPIQGVKVCGKLIPHPGKTILANDDKFTSCDFWTKSGVIDGGKFYYSDKCDTQKFGYRLLFTFENIDDFPLEDVDYMHSSYEYRIKNDIEKYKNVIMQEINDMKSYLSSFLIPSPTLDEHYFGKFWPQRIGLINPFVNRLHEQGKFIVEHIHERLNSSGKLVITGCVGVGKTTMARWLSTCYENRFDKIFWIDCGNEDLLLACFNSLAALIGITDIDKKLLPAITTEIYEKLQGKHCLFIFDGAANHTTLRLVLPSKANSSKITCLITSRHGIWGQPSDYGMMECYKLPVFSDIEAMNFLTNEHAFGDSSTTSDVQELATTLHNHPLALRHAVAFVKGMKDMDPSYDIRKCLKDLESNPHALLHSCKLDDYSHSIYKAIMQTCKQIKKYPNGKLAIIILSIVAYFDCEGIEYELFYSLDSYSDAEILDALYLLKEYSFINCPTQKTRFYVVPLFQLVIRLINKNYEIKILKKALTCLDNSPTFCMKHLEKVFKYDLIYPSLMNEFKLLHKKLMTPNVCVKYSDFNRADIAHSCVDEAAMELNCITYPDNEKF